MPAPSASLLELLTLTTSDRVLDKGEPASFLAFSSTLADILRLSAVSSHPRLASLRRHLGLTSVCLYAAYTDTPLEDVCKLSGTPHPAARRHLRAAGLPRSRADLLLAFQGLLVAAMFERDASGMFAAFQKMAGILDRVGDALNLELDKADANLERVTLLLEALSKVSFPFMFLYRDRLDPSLDNRLTRMMQQDWTQKTLQTIMALCRECPSHPGTPPLPS